MRQFITRSGFAVGVALVAAPAFGVPVQAADPPPTPDGQYATFEGDVIDLATDRGDAKACAITPTGNRCYRSEAAMDVAETALAANSPTLAGGGCSSSLRLYTGTGYSGTVTYFTIRSTWLNLSASGVDNTTSSYKVGACSAALRADAGGGGSSYPGSTSAGAQSSSMVSGWDNRVSSVRLS